MYFSHQKITFRDTGAKALQPFFRVRFDANRVISPWRRNRCGWRQALGFKGDDSGFSKKTVDATKSLSGALTEKLHGAG
jgi:hypothetical protein